MTCPDVKDLCVQREKEREREREREREKEKKRIMSVSKFIRLDIDLNRR